MSRQLDENLLAEMRKMMRAGATDHAIANTLDVCSGTARNYRKKWGIGHAFLSRSRRSPYLTGNNKSRSGDLVCDPDRILAPKPRLRPVIEERPKPRMLPSSIPLPTKTQLMGSR